MILSFTLLHEFVFVFFYILLDLPLMLFVIFVINVNCFKRSVPMIIYLIINNKFSIPCGEILVLVLG